MEKAYQKAIEFTNILRRQGAKGFYKVLLLRRLGSSIKAGLTSAIRIYKKRAINSDMLSEAEQEDLEDFELEEKEIGNIMVGGDEIRLLEDIIELHNCTSCIY